MDKTDLLLCYNKGCGLKFDASSNKEDSCCFHSGVPIFHDAYKQWSCCKKKSADFTEFLNYKGCSLGKHSNDKPIERVRENIIDEAFLNNKDESVKLDIVSLKRPSFKTACVIIKPDVTPAFKKLMDSQDVNKKMKGTSLEDGNIPIGTMCKRAGCNSSYDSALSDDTICIHHPGAPIFHEGYKYWTCCQKKTSDFSAFLGQVGCDKGQHKWIQEEDSNIAKCRWDWHQTPGNVIVAVYAKNYDYKNSTVKINPIRLCVKLLFPQQGNAEFNIDLELRGIIDVSKANVKMFGTKVEITLPKSEAGHWLKLDFPKDQESKADPKTEEPNSDHKVKTTKVPLKVESEDESDVDLDDLEASTGVQLSELANFKFCEDACN
ncbi:unnamed protein product [Diamesa serratosioi]